MIPYSILQPGMVIGTTDTYNPLAAVIRTRERGIRHSFDPYTASHVLIVCKQHGLFYGIEMAFPKIRKVDLDKYDHSLRGDHMVFGALHPELCSEPQMEACNEWLLTAHEMGIKYDIKGLFEFLDMGDDNPKKLICSELFREMLKNRKAPYPDRWNEKVSPWNIQAYNGLVKRF